MEGLARRKSCVRFLHELTSSTHPSGRADITSAGIDRSLSANPAADLAVEYLVFGSHDRQSNTAKTIAGLIRSAGDRKSAPERERYTRIRARVARNGSPLSTQPPTKRCHETASAAPSEDCVITKVVIGAQYASGSRNSRATNYETSAANAVRPECTKTGHRNHSDRSPLSSASVRVAIKLSPVFGCAYSLAYRALFGFDPLSP